MTVEKRVEDMMNKMPSAREEIEQFFMENNLSLAAKSNYAAALLSLTQNVDKPLKKMSKKDIMHWVGYLDKEGYAEGSKSMYKACVKRFFAWLYKCEEGEYPEFVKWLKVSYKHNQLKDKLASEQEVFKLIEAAMHYRDKALVATLYESACRISELLSLKIEHVKFDKYGAIIMVSGKTGERPIRLINAVPYLQGWLNLHPKKSDPEAFVFIRLKGQALDEPLGKDHVAILFKELSRRAGLDRKIHPHMLRHGRLTDLATKIHEPILRKFAGWTARSDMPAIYVHLSGRDIDQAILKAEGVDEIKEEVKPEPSKLEPKKCPRCEAVNPADFKFCGKCSMALDLKAVMEVEDAKRDLNEIEKIMTPDFDKFIDRWLDQHPEVVKKLEDKLSEKLLMRFKG